MNPRSLAVPAVLALAVAAAAQEMPWAKDYAAAKAAAQKSNKLVMLDFYTDW